MKVASEGGQMRLFPAVMMVFFSSELLVRTKMGFPWFSLIFLSADARNLANGRVPDPIVEFC